MQKMIVFFSPFLYGRMGEMLSIFRLCQYTRQLMNEYPCLLSTLPGAQTAALKNPLNNEPIYRWPQVVEYGKEVEELYLHLPAFYVANFYESLKKNEIKFLKSIPGLHINILNQGNDGICNYFKFKKLYMLTASLAVSTSDMKYATQYVCNRAGVPLYKMPSFIDFNACVKKDFENKKKIILYSPDSNPVKAEVLKYLRENLAEFELKEIRGLAGDEMREAVAEALFCINFGTDFDKYFIQPYYAKSIGITVYSDIFCYASEIKSLPFVYETYYELMRKITEDIGIVTQDKEEYERVSINAYSYFEQRINDKNKISEMLGKFYHSEPDFMPPTRKIDSKIVLDDIRRNDLKNGKPEISAQNVKEPLLTAIIFTYNHQSSIAKCIESLVNQKTSYIYEIHIWDDCSIDGTSDICRKYSEEYPDKIRLVIQKENTFLKPDLEMQSYAAIQNIKTKYFCYIDGDDYWCDENKVQIALDFLENNLEYIGFAHDTLLLNTFTNTSLSYVHEELKFNIQNPVTFSADAPFFHASSRIFRKCGFEKMKILPIDYKQYYYHLFNGPIYYYDKIMAAKVLSECSTFENLGKGVINLISMFPFKLQQLFDFQQDEFCTSLQKKYCALGLGEMSYNKLCLFKKIFGIKKGWTLWFILTFVPIFGLKCINENFIYSTKNAKKRMDRLITKNNLEHVN